METQTCDMSLAPHKTFDITFNQKS